MLPGPRFQYQRNHRSSDLDNTECSQGSGHWGRPSAALVAHNDEAMAIGW